MAEYRIKGETLTDIADAIRAKKDTTAIFTPAQMAIEIEGIVVGDELPNAEDASFGESNTTEYGISGTFDTNYMNDQSGKIRFTANETFGLLGLRSNVKTGTGVTLKLYDSNEVLMKTVSFTATLDGWNESLFDTPINLVAGATYTIHSYVTKGGGYRATKKNITFNSKITYVAAGYAAGTALPTDKASSYEYLWVVPDIIIGKPITETVTTEYKIQKDTLTAIAEEVKRITGTSGTMSTAQIITALQGVAVQSTE